MARAPRTKSIPRPILFPVFTVHISKQVGFLVIDELAQQEGIGWEWVEHKAIVGKGEICGKRVLLAKPTTYMNESGRAVAALMKYYKVRAHMLVRVACFSCVKNCSLWF